MFTRVTRLGLVILLGALVLSVGCTSPSQSTTTARSITVVGQGEASGKPDIVRTTVGVESQSLSIDEAMSETNSKMASILAALREMGIAGKDLQTSNFNVYLERQSKPGIEETQGPLYYHVSNQLSVTLRDVGKLGEMLGKVLSSGANSVYGVSFDVDDRDALESDARAKAVADARSRAENLAQLSNVKLGNVLTLSEVVSNGVGPLRYSSSLAGAGGDAVVQAGEMEIGVSVEVTYSIQ
jgi:uncharacterized protein